MSQSVSVEISQAGNTVKTLELGVTSDLGDILAKVREVQQQTNDFLTQLISEQGADINEEDNDDQEESDDEPEVKIQKTQ